MAKITADHLRAYLYRHQQAQMSGPSPSSHPELVTSPSRYPELATSPTSEMLLQPDTLVTSALIKPALNSTTVNSSFSTICELPSPNECKKNCANCATKQRTYMNMLQKNKRLHVKLQGIKKLLGTENGSFSVKKFSNKFKRKTQLVTKWKDKYTPLMEAFKDTHNLLVRVESLDLQAKTLESKLIAYQEENDNLAAVNQQLESVLDRAENDHANLKQENAQLKRSLEKAEIANAHFKQVHEQLRSVFGKTENNAADLKCKYSSC